jgi:hypothetical protein
MVGRRLKPQGRRLRANIEKTAKMESAFSMEWKLNCTCEHQLGPATIGRCKRQLDNSSRDLESWSLAKDF